MVLHNARQTLLGVERLYRNQHPSRFIARLKMTKELKIGLGTLENILRDRVKTISAELAEGIRVLWIKTIEAEIARLEHELQMARQIGTRLDSAQVGQIEAHLCAAKELLNGKGE